MGKLLEEIRVSGDAETALPILETLDQLSRIRLTTARRKRLAPRVLGPARNGGSQGYAQALRDETKYGDPLLRSNYTTVAVMTTDAGATYKMHEARTSSGTTGPPPPARRLGAVMGDQKYRRRRIGRESFRRLDVFRHARCESLQPDGRSHVLTADTTPSVGSRFRALERKDLATKLCIGGASVGFSDTSPRYIFTVANTG